MLHDPWISQSDTLRLDENAVRPAQLTIYPPDNRRPFVVAFGERAIVLGSAKSATISVPDSTVSAAHCELRFDSGVLVVRDLNSTNGTWVGGVRIREAVLLAGATITIGRTRLHLEALNVELPSAAPLPGMIGCTGVMRTLYARCRRLSNYSAPVLIYGETGTGKELVARALHSEGSRSKGPFVVLNVSAIPRELVESELFGHERGAFTGAHATKIGAFEAATGGTLFLDEIGELPLEAQPKLLRALDGYEVRRVGATGSGRAADVRVVAATHRDIEAGISNGSFRADLFHRLSAYPLRTIPLRERSEDIPLLVDKLLGDLRREYGVVSISSAAIRKLQGHSWPGNIRELRNAVLRAADEASGQVIDDCTVERILFPQRCRPDTSRAKELLELHHGNISKAAREAGMPRSTFRRLAFGLDDESAAYSDA